jgi:hypothetical protein
VDEVLAGAPVGLRAPLRRLAGELARLGTEQVEDYQPLKQVPDALAEALQRVNTALGEHVQKHPLEVGALLEFYFEVLGLQRAPEFEAWLQKMNITDPAGRVKPILSGHQLIEQMRAPRLAA